MKIFLYLDTEDGTRALQLDGDGVSAPVRGAFYPAGVGRAAQEGGQEVIDEEIKLSLAGTRAQLQNLLDTLSELLGFARYDARTRNDRLYLQVEYEDVGVTWQSQVLSGRVSANPLGLAARELGGDVARVYIRRVNFWEESAGEVLPLTNRNGSRQASLTVYNHYDITAGHDNFVDIAAEDIAGDLPAPIELTITHTNTGRSLSQVWIGQMETGGALPAWKPVYEGELGTAGSGVTLTGTADAGSSAGYFGRLAWTAGAEARVASFEVSASHMSLFRGKEYRPILRLANNHAYSDLWLKMKVTYGAGHTAAYDSGWVQSAAGASCVEFNAVRLPPYPARSNTHDAMSLSLYAMKTASAAVTLDVDFVHLLPTDGYNRLDMIEAVAAGYNLQEGEKSGSYRWNAATLLALPSHARAGRSLYLTPGMNTRFFFLHRSGASMLIDTTFTVSMRFQRRRRVL